MFAGQHAPTLAALFTGAAVYVNVAEQPARLDLDNRSFLAEWKLASKRCDVMQASLAMAGGAFGFFAYSSASQWRGPLSAIVLLANWPYTLFFIAPTNNRLMKTPPEAATGETRRMLELGEPFMSGVMLLASCDADFPANLVASFLRSRAR